MFCHVIIGCDDGLTLMVTFPLVILRMLKPTVGIMSSLNWPDCGARERFTQDVMSLKSDSSVRTRSQAAGADVIYSPKRLNLCADDLLESVCVSNTWKCWLDRMPDADWLRNWDSWSTLFLIDSCEVHLIAVRSCPDSIVLMRFNLIHCFKSVDTVSDTKCLIQYIVSDDLCQPNEDMQYDTLCLIVPYLI